MKDKNISKILNETEAGYDQMAEKFSGTRNFFWRDFEFIKNHVSAGDKILDFGCGNGRLLEILQDKQIEYYGADVSQKLIDLAREKYPEWSQSLVKISGQASLPFPDNFFNAVISVAVFHHLPDQKFRLEMAKELYRVTQPGGKIITTAWNLWQPKYRKYVWKNIGQKIVGQSNLDFLDCAIPFKNNFGETFQRFHHAYTKKKLAKLFSAAGFSVEEVRVVNNKNIVLVAKK